MGKQYTQGSGSNPILLSGVEVNDSVQTDPLAGTVNDLNVPGSALVSTIKINASSSFTLNGLAGGSDGRCMRLENQSNFSGTIAANAGGSQAANRFASAATLGAGQTLDIVWNTTQGKWLVESASGASGGSVTSVSVTTQVGISGVVTNPTTTPAIVLTATGRLLSFQVLTGSGNYTPTPGTTAIFVTCIGGGGGGGGALGDASNNAAGGGGGAGGLTSIYLGNPVGPYSYVCGAGGTGGTGGGTASTNGGATNFDIVLAANGGTGSANVSTAGGSTINVAGPTAGGAVTIPGTISMTGPAGGVGISGLASLIATAKAGVGGSLSPYGGGGSAAGGNATGFGAGGGGRAVAAGAAAGTGGNGAAGAILVWEYS